MPIDGAEAVEGRGGAMCCTSFWRLGSALLLSSSSTAPSLPTLAASINADLSYCKEVVEGEGCLRRVIGGFHRLHVVCLLEGLKASCELGAEKYLRGALGLRGLGFRVLVWPCAGFKVQSLRIHRQRSGGTNGDRTRASDVDLQ